jgi:Phage tail tube protein
MSATLSPTTPTNRRLAGITVFTVNGQTFPVTEFAWDPGSYEAEMMMSLSGVDGYNEKPVAPYISGKFRDGNATSVTGFTGLRNATVVVQLANGKSVVGHNMVYTARAGVAGADATFDFKFEGLIGTVQEIGGA